jgi:hypothetical protein
MKVRMTAIAATRAIASQSDVIEVSMMSAASWNVRPAISQRA